MKVVSGAITEISSCLVFAICRQKLKSYSGSSLCSMIFFFSKLRGVELVVAIGAPPPSPLLKAPGLTLTFEVAVEK